MINYEIHIKNRNGEIIGTIHISGNTMHLMYEYLKESFFKDGKYPLNSSERKDVECMISLIDDMLAKIRGDQMTNEETQIRECARQIRKYCETHPSCNQCIFLSENNTISVCSLQFTDPERWKFPSELKK